MISVLNRAVRRASERQCVGSMRNESGFSLTEMLAAMLILTMVATLLSTGVPVAIDTYTKTVKAANAQLALSTTTAVLRSELGTAREIILNSDDIYYLSDTNGSSWTSVTNYGPSPALGHGLQKSYYLGSVTAGDLSGLSIDGDPYELVSSSAITGDLRVAYSEVSMSGDYITIGLIEVIDSAEPSGGNVLASIENYRILSRFAG